GGGGGGGGGGGDSCPLIKRNYGICDSKEPKDPRAQGSFKTSSAASETWSQRAWAPWNTPPSPGAGVAAATTA
ncbi:hypothetical protein K4G64_33650, partial [Streptomyces sp. WAC04114]|nr:hypothetical protein [Streptomyces sp. WAC04114]